MTGRTSDCEAADIDWLMIAVNGGPVLSNVSTVHFAGQRWTELRATGLSQVADDNRIIA